MPLGPLPESESRLRRALSFVRALPLTVVGLGSLLVFNFLQVVSLVLVPFSRKSFRRFNRWCADTWWGWCVVAADKINGTRIVITGDEVPPRENALVVVNHQQMPDVTLLMAFARSKERLGDLKWFVKSVVKHVPGVGWGMRFINCIFVKRDWNADRARIRGTFAKIVDERIPLWLITFVEGTRLTAEKLKNSQEYARSQGLEPTLHVLLPRTKGFVASMEGLREHLDTVYDVTIGYVDGVPSLWQWIKGSVRRAHLHVRRYSVDDLPHQREELADWLRERFQEKDQLLAHFYEHGFFPETAVVDGASTSVG